MKSLFTGEGGKRILINESAELVMKINVKDFDPVYDDPRSGDIRHSLADISRANEFGYEPKFTIEQELKETINWYVNNQ